jgi:nucleotide-binding universal stress UspA family protein
VENGTAEQTGDGLVVFAYDGSDEAKNAIREAGRQLRSGRDAIVLSVWQPLATVPFAGLADGALDVEESIEAEARKVAAEGAELARSAGFAATPLVVSGSPIWHTIVATAEAHDASIVVMGSHGRTGINLVLMGSVAAAVVRHTERPTLIVHAPPGERDD